MEEKILFKVIENEVLCIENELATLGKGIFFAPELYIGFRISKSIYQNRLKIFKNIDIEWHREFKIGKNKGLFDIVFTDKKLRPVIVIELKLRDTFDAYNSDILKLQSLADCDSSTICKRYFCVLLDSFSKNNDTRIEKLLASYKLSQVGLRSFKTEQNWYKSQVFCNLNLIRI